MAETSSLRKTSLLSFLGKRSRDEGGAETSGESAGNHDCFPKPPKRRNSDSTDCAAVEILGEFDNSGGIDSDDEIAEVDENQEEYEDETGMEADINSSGTVLSSSGTKGLVLAVKRVPSMKMLKTLTSSWRKEFRKNQKTYVKCSVCSNFPEVCKAHFMGRVPAIASESGTHFQSHITWSHHNSEVHKACIEAKRNELLYKANSTEHPMTSAVSTANQQLFLKLTAHMFYVYNDAKRGTLSAWSWPSKYITRFAASRVSVSEAFQPYEPKADEIQYVNPSHHRECLGCIADCGREQLVKSLDEALAVAVKVDGQVDAFQVTNKFVAVSVVSAKGFLCSKFVSSEDPSDQGADGLVEAVKCSFDELRWTWAVAKSKLCRVTSDGASENTRVRGGMWAKLEGETELKLLKFWCTCHRSSLAFKTMMSEVPELKHLLSDAVAVSTFYRVSGKRVSQLALCASRIDENYVLYHWPQFKEVCIESV